jgi:inner membrane protein
VRELHDAKPVESGVKHGAQRTACATVAARLRQSRNVPTILSHPAVPLAIGVGFGSGIVSRRLLAAGIAAAIVPDLDVYLERVTSSIGHRGVTHTIVFAIACGVLAAVFARALDAKPRTAFAFVATATASHPILDAFTNGGSGIPFFWPFDHERYFMPIQPIEVSPLGITRFFSERGVEVILSELVWVWLPAVVLAAALCVCRKASRHLGVRQDPF